MASYSNSDIVSFKIDSAVVAGQVVKFGTDDEHIAAASAVSDALIGVAQEAATTAEDLVEVAIGGGARALCGDTVTRGAKLTVDASGYVVVSSTANDQIIGIAMQAGVVNDLIWIQIARSNF